ncbi:acylphosphatase [Gallibacterium trehalosifermentans]|uniref:Acylphosphatase n=1 Tax=Gallibacterium trehalosifermentans TaxID=516935 RepID=A0ABV6H2Z3_9PAST
MQTQQFIIYGHVQGVGFRYFTWREALRLGLTGWVKNQPDGSVLVIAQGSEQQLMQFNQWLQQGPKTATVQYIETITIDNAKQYDHFSIAH